MVTLFTGYYICKVMVVRWSGKLPRFLMKLEKNICNHCPFSLSATRVTTLRLNIQLVFVLGHTKAIVCRYVYLGLGVVMVMLLLYASNLCRRKWMILLK